MLNPIKTVKKYLGNKMERAVIELIERNSNPGSVRSGGVPLDGGVGRGKGGLFSTLTMQGFPWQQNQMDKYLGEYNPDSIPLTTYDKMRWDGQLRLGLSAIKLPIMSRDFWIECEDKDIQAFVNQNIKEIWRPLLKSMLTALDYGFATHEKIWEAVEGYNVIDKKEDVNYKKDMIKYKNFRDLHPETITMDYNKKMKFKGFYQNKDQGGISAYVPAKKAFVFTHDKEWGNIYGWSRMKPAYPYWYTYWILDAWHERWLQKRGIPPIVVKYPIGKSQVATSGTTVNYKDNQQIAEDVGKSWQPDTVITIPSDEIKQSTGRSTKWEVEAFQDVQRLDSFVEAKEKLDIRKLRAILVPERAITQESGTGSFKMAEQHTWIMMESLKGLISDIRAHINEFIIPGLVAVNFGDKAPKAILMMEEIGKELTGALFEIYLNLIAGNKAHPSISQMEELLNIPIETDEEKKEREVKESQMPTGGNGIQEDKIPSAIRSQSSMRFNERASQLFSRMGGF